MQRPVDESSCESCVKVFGSHPRSGSRRFRHFQGVTPAATNRESQRWASAPPRPSVSKTGLGLISRISNAAQADPRMSDWMAEVEPPWLTVCCSLFDNSCGRRGRRMNWKPEGWRGTGLLTRLCAGWILPIPVQERRGEGEPKLLERRG